MTRSFSLLRRYIREAIDLGKVQFAMQRIDDLDRSPYTDDIEVKEIPGGAGFFAKKLATRKLYDEEDTPEERALYDELYKRLESGKHITPQTAKIIIDLIDSKYGQAPGGSGFFVEPSADTNLYRGQDVDRAWLDKHVSEEDIRLLEEQLRAATGKRGVGSVFPNRRLQQQINDKDLIELKVPYVFTQLRGWSKNSTKSIEFAAEYALYGDRFGDSAGYTPQSVRKIQGVAAVFVTTPSTSDAKFLDFEHSMYLTGAGETFSHERECINLEPVTVRKAAIALINR